MVRIAGDNKGAIRAFGSLGNSVTRRAAVASTDRCKRSGFLQAVKHTDAPN